MNIIQEYVRQWIYLLSESTIIDDHANCAVANSIVVSVRKTTQNTNFTNIAIIKRDFPLSHKHKNTAAITMRIFFLYVCFCRGIVFFFFFFCVFLFGDFVILLRNNYLFADFTEIFVFTLYLCVFVCSAAIDIDTVVILFAKQSFFSELIRSVHFFFVSSNGPCTLEWNLANVCFYLNFFCFRFFCRVFDLRSF